jgi:hypothetical protein
MDDFSDEPRSSGRAGKAVLHNRERGQDVKLLQADRPVTKLLQYYELSCISAKIGCANISAE